MNIALIIAGGTGARMNQPIPKQFITVKGKPILVYTIEAFQKNEQIDAIAVVCLDGWQDVVWKYAETYKLSKLKWITKGGSTGQESLRNGMQLLKDNCELDDIIIIHDAVRPLVSDDIINSNIACVIQNGNAITFLPSNEALLYSEDGEKSNKTVNRNLIYRTQTPQSLRLSKFIWIHEQAIENEIQNSVATCTLLIELEQTVHFVLGLNTNFKITTAEDIALFEAYLETQKMIHR